MKEKLIKEILRSKLLMGYELSKTYSDNLSEQNPVWPKEVYMTDDQIKGEQEKQKKEKEKERLETYPNYCKYPDKTYPYPDACGAILDPGITLLKAPVGTQKEQEEVKNFCNYGMPSPTSLGGVSSLLLPKDTEIWFISQENIIRTVQNFIKKNTERYNNEENIRLLTENLVQVLPIGSVGGFTFVTDNLEYILKLELDTNVQGSYGKYINPEINKWKPVGYYPKNDPKGKPFEYLKCTDTRTPRQKFIDDYGWVLQWGAIVATIIASAFTGGGTLALTFEILIEMGVGAAVAYRDFEKGNNVDMAVSILTGLAPWLKTLKGFRGVSADGWDEISTLLETKRYNGFKSADDYARFYDDLSEEGKEAWNILARRDDIGRDILTNQLKQEFAENGSKIFWKEAAEMFAKNPDKVWKIDFVRRLWVREAGTNLLISGLGILAELSWGEELNAKDRESLNDLQLVIPAEAQLEILENLYVINDAEKQKRIWRKIVQRMSRESVNNPELEKERKEFENWYMGNSIVKQVFQEEGEEYKDIEEDKISSEETKMSIEQLENGGYVKFPYDQYPEDYPKDQLLIKDRWYWIKKENLKDPYQDKENPSTQDTIPNQKKIDSTNKMKIPPYF
jgi:hypothetical protein